MKKSAILLLVLAGTILLAGCPDMDLYYEKEEVDEQFDAILKPVAYGNVNSDGTIRDGSGNFTVAHPAAGYYTIQMMDSLVIHYEHDIIHVTPIGFSNERNAIWSTTGDGSLIGISIFDNDVKVDSSFSFMVYKL